MFSLNVPHIPQLKLIYTIFGDPITGYRQNLLDLYSVSDLSKDSQLWKKRETNQESWSISDNVYIQYLTQSIVHSWKPFMCVSIF